MVQTRMAATQVVLSPDIAPETAGWWTNALVEDTMKVTELEPDCSKAAHNIENN